jgi:hypothetical protein
VGADAVALRAEAADPEAVTMLGRAVDFIAAVDKGAAEPEAEAEELAVALPIVK